MKVGGGKMQIGTSEIAMQKNAEKIRNVKKGGKGGGCKCQFPRNSSSKFSDMCPVFQAIAKKQCTNAWRRKHTNCLKKIRPLYYLSSILYPSSILLILFFK